MEALKEAHKAAAKCEVPIGCIIVRDNVIIGRGHNLKESLRQAYAHAEVLAIQQASIVLNGWRLTNCDLYVTIEPCAMCAGLIYQSRIGRLVFGAYDYRGGACGGSMNILDVPDLNHSVKIEPLVLEHNCSEVLKCFFTNRRKV